MEAKERSETLARLYTLRAGLSAASEKRDEVTKRLEELNQTTIALNEQEEREAAPLRKQLKMQELNGDIFEDRHWCNLGHSSYWDERYERYNYAKKEEYLKNKELYDSGFESYKHIKYQQEQISLYQRDADQSKRPKIIALCLWLIFLAGAIACGICSAFTTLLLLIPAAILFVAWCITFGVFISFAKYQAHWQKTADEHRAYLQKAKSLVAQQKQKLAAIEKKYPPLHAKAREQAASAVAPVIDGCNVLNAALEKEFGAFLDERDWKHLDLIIFCFETGRADSFKEALQQVDREVQTNRIVGAIENAGTLIARTIHTGMTALRADMVRCFSLLSEQIDSLGRQQLDAIGKLSQQVEGMSAQVKGLSAEVGKLDFSHALAAKASVSSEQLAEDMHYMRTLAENAGARRRNGL